MIVFDGDDGLEHGEDIAGGMMALPAEINKRGCSVEGKKAMSKRRTF